LRQIAKPFARQSKPEIGSSRAGARSDQFHCVCSPGSSDIRVPNRLRSYIGGSRAYFTDGGVAVASLVDYCEKLRLGKHRRIVWYSVCLLLNVHLD
jgi:hypothetical protein